jgi:hypothetical protein
MFTAMCCARFCCNVASVRQCPHEVDATATGSDVGKMLIAQRTSVDATCAGNAPATILATA